MTLPENAPSTDVKYGGFWIRFVASVIDSLLVAFIIQPFIRALLGQPMASAKVEAQLWDTLLNLVLPAAAVIVFWVQKSATPGKMLTRLRVVDAASGAPPTVRQSIIRYLGYYVSMLSLFLGFFWVGWDKRKQGFHDKMAGTVVIQDPRPDGVA